ncbi:MAG: cupin domain-containing protein [Chloroflexota bacterium]|nr:cupin domain-containing protein [Chloroflexota bacterium]
MTVEATELVGTRLLFENDRIRVWDLALAPGESLEKHIHRLDFCFIVVQGGSLRHVDPDNPANDQDVQYHADQIVFIEADGGLIHHRLINVGTTPYRNYVIELKEDEHV